MKLLALDTSTDQMAVALHVDGRDWFLDSEGGAKASVALLPAIQRGLSAFGLALGQLDGIACGIGPGAFTGLRTAVSVAQGLAYGADLPVWALDSLAIVAAAHAIEPSTEGEPPLCWVAMDARLDELYAGAYGGQGGLWRAAHGPALFTLAAWREAWAARPAPVVGNAPAVFGERLGLPAGALAAPPRHSRAAALGQLAMQVAGAERPGTAAQLLPVYLRDKVAQTTAERAAARLAVSPTGAGA